MLKGVIFHRQKPFGFTAKVHHLDALVGRTYKMPFTHFGGGHAHSFGGQYLELIPNELIRHADTFDVPESVWRNANHDIAQNGFLRRSLFSSLSIKLVMASMIAEIATTESAFKESWSAT